MKLTTQQYDLIKCRVHKHGWTIADINEYCNVDIKRDNLPIGSVIAVAIDDCAVYCDSITGLYDYCDMDTNMDIDDICDLCILLDYDGVKVIYDSRDDYARQKWEWRKTHNVANSVSRYNH